MVIAIILVAAGAMTAVGASIGAVRRTLDAVVAIDVPRLNVAVRLSAGAEALVAEVPTLARAPSQTARSTSRARIDGDLAALDATLADLGTDEASAKLVNALSAQLHDLRANVEKIDTITARRVALEEEFSFRAARLKDLRATFKRLSLEDRREWVSLASDALVLDHDIGGESDPPEIQRQLGELSDRLKRLRDSVPPDIAYLLSDLDLELGDGGLGRPRLEQRRIAYLLETRLAVNGALSDRILRAARELGAETESRVTDAAGKLRAQLDRQITLSIAALGATILLVVGLILYFGRSVVGRLLRLRSWLGLVQENREAPAIQGYGSDEVGDIARALDYFVRAVGDRERALRATRDSAEAALKELQRTQDELIRNEKLASLGELVAGVAHEVNTPLGIIMSASTQLVDEVAAFQRKVDDESITMTDLVTHLETARDLAALLSNNGNRAVKLVKSFKQVAVDRASDLPRRFDLKQFIEELLTSLGPELKRGRHRHEIDCPDGVMLNTLPGALSQILTNLVLNAHIHAFCSGRAGTIRITARESGAGWIDLIVSDDGDGIPADIVNRVFDPFFTTKRGSGGSGLGLHIVHGLVTNALGGSIRLESTVGVGSAFTLHLPMTLPE